MEFRFSEQALAFERAVDDFLAVEWSPEVRRRLDASPDRYAMEREFRRKLAERGWLTMSWPREYGGQERSYE